MKQRFIQNKTAIIKTAIIAGILAPGMIACHNTKSKENEQKESTPDMSLLKDSLSRIAANCDGDVGIALFADSDTILINNENKYPLMSVFKLHQAIALCNLFERTGNSLDTMVSITRASLNPDTWSPMLKEHNEEAIRISAIDLMRYTLRQSDNNASNYMFENMQTVEDADSYIATIIPRESFRISATEGEMFANHDLCYNNTSSPYGAALLIDKLFTDSMLSVTNTEMIQTALKECATGIDRISAPLADKKGVVVAHKTGSGFRNGNGRLSAHNDVAYVIMPDSTHYTLAVLIKDFNGNEEGASDVISSISQTIYNHLTRKN